MRGFFIWLVLLFALPILPATWQWKTQETSPQTAQILSLSPRAARLLDPNTFVLVDARTPSEFADSHLPGAISLPPGQWSESSFAPLLRIPRDQLVIVYCGGGTCRAASEVAQRLVRELKLTNVRILQGGLPAWEQAAP